MPNYSLKEVKDYGEGRGGIHTSTHQYRHLQDLKSLVNELANVRNGSLTSNACDCHGNELNNGYSKTTCGSNTMTTYDKSTLSLHELADYLGMARTCSCNAVKVEDCDCNMNCLCNCDVCHCNCDYCGCNCNYTSS